MNLTAPRLGGLTASLALVLCLPGLCFADDGISGDYALKGVRKKASVETPYTSRIRINTKDGKLTITRSVTYQVGAGESQAGAATLTKKQLHDLRLGEELRIELGPKAGATGIAAVVEGNGGSSSAGARPVLRFRLSDPAKGRSHAIVTYPDGTRSEAWGRKVDADDHDHHGALMVFTKGGLKRALKSELKKALKKGVDLDETLKLHDFLHVGMGGEIAVVGAEDQSAYQTKSLHERTTPGVWVATTASGGIRLPFVTSIPLGSAGTATVGFVPGVELAYEVVDLYDRPAGITDLKGIGSTFWKAGKRAFKLPLDAARAEALTVGATRSMEGQLTIAITGSLGIGWDTTEVNDMVEIGASARIGGFYRIRRPLRMVVERLDKKQVRLHLTKAKERSFGVEARLFAGASIDDGAVSDELSIEYVEPVVKLAANGVDRIVKSVFRFELEGELSRTDREEFEVSYRFDLRKDEARKSYERAVRGDLTRAATAAHKPEQTGVQLEFRIFDLERRIVAKADLHLSELVEGRVRKISSDKLLDIEDQAGQTKYHVFRFNRQRALGVFAFWKKIRSKWDERLDIEMVRGTDVTGMTEAEIKRLPWRMAQRAFRFRYVLNDPHTRKSEGERLRRVIAAMGLDGVESLPRPKRRLFRSRYGRTQTGLTVDISERGIRQVMAITTKNRPEFEQHYRRAYAAVHQKQPKAKDVRKFYERMHGLAKAAPGRPRGEYLKELAEDSGWDLTMITAIVSMSPTGVRIHASIDGKRISFSDGREGRYFEEFNPNLYGH